VHGCVNLVRLFLSESSCTRFDGSLGALVGHRKSSSTLRLGVERRGHFVQRLMDQIVPSCMLMSWKTVRINLPFQQRWIKTTLKVAVVL
jgi:hypothetical protein